MGYRVHTFSPDADSPTGQVADLEVVAAYDDLDAVRRSRKQVDVVTFEFENVPSATADGGRGTRTGAARRARPARRRSTARARRASSPSTDFRSRRSPLVRTSADLASRARPDRYRACSRPPASATTARGRYRDALARGGRGGLGARCGNRTRSSSSSSTFEREVSVVGARGADGWSVPLRRSSRTHIATTSWTSRSCPARVDPAIERRAGEIVREPCETLRVRRRAVRRVLPDARRRAADQRAGAASAQLGASHDRRLRDQPVRAAGARGLRAAARDRPSSLRPAAMANLLGDLWATGRARLGRRLRRARRASCTSTASVVRVKAAKWAT